MNSVHRAARVNHMHSVARVSRDQLLALVREQNPSPRVLRAFGKTDRKDYVPLSFAGAAYEDRPIPLPDGQTTSQPTLVAFILSKLGLREESRVLEVGTGFGFQTALLSEIVGSKGLVVSIEFSEILHREARKRLAGRKNVLLVHGDGKKGFPGKAPFDAIVVSAACAELPNALFEQLKSGGRIACPQETGFGQDLVLVERTPEGERRATSLMPVAFVPLR